MRIGVDNRFLEGNGGIAHYLANVLPELEKCLSNTDDIIYYDRVIHKRKIPFILWELVVPYFLRKDKIDVFIGPANILPWWKPKGIRFIVVLHDMMFFSKLSIRHLTLRQFFGRHFLRSNVLCWNNYVDKIVCVSTHTKSELVNLFPSLEIISTVVHEGVNVPLTKSECGSRTGFLHLANSDPRKNTDAIVTIFRDLGLPLTLVGSYSVRYTDIDGITALGYISDDQLTELYQTSAALIYYTEDEGFGLPLLEAFSCGCDVIAKRIPALQEIGGDLPLFIDSFKELRRLLIEHKPEELRSEKLIAHSAQFSWSNTAKGLYDML